MAQRKQVSLHSLEFGSKLRVLIFMYPRLDKRHDETSPLTIIEKIRQILIVTDLGDSDEVGDFSQDSSDSDSASSSYHSSHSRRRSSR